MFDQTAAMFDQTAAMFDQIRCGLIKHLHILSKNIGLLPGMIDGSSLTQIGIDTLCGWNYTATDHPDKFDRNNRPALLVLGC
jgi:hypothetical protein